MEFSDLPPFQEFIYFQESTFFLIINSTAYLGTTVRPYEHLYSGYTLRSLIEAPLITREVLPETYFLLVVMAADAQAAGPFIKFQASCS